MYEIIIIFSFHSIFYLNTQNNVYLQGNKFEVKAGSLGFSITVFTIAAVLSIVLLVVRRNTNIFGRGELGGPKIPRYVSSIFLLVLWLAYVLISSLETYGHIQGF